MKKTILASALFFILFNCTFKQNLERETKPAEKYNVRTEDDRLAIYKDTLLEINLELIDTGMWEKLLEYECFKNKKSESSNWRAPALLFAHAAIRNTGAAPLKITNIRALYGQSEKFPVQAANLLKKCKSPAYSMIDFKSLLKTRRLLGEKTSVEDVDFDNDSVGFSPEFIASGDTISKIMAFDWIPVEYRTFKISIQFESAGDIRTIDFEFKRLEYREAGPFSKPEKEDVDDILW